MRLTDFLTSDDSSEFYPGSKRTIDRKPKTSEPERPDVPEWDRHPQMITVGGVPTEFFTIGALAEALGRRPVTIRKWETTGVIPVPLFRKTSAHNEGSRRLYTRAQIEGIVKIAAEERVLDNRKPISQTNFTERVRELYQELANDL